MKKNLAILERDKIKPRQIGRPFDNKKGWEIQDVIVAAGKKNAYDVYEKMYYENLTNEAALLFFPSSDDDYDVFVISHQWTWGDGHLLCESVDNYRKYNAI